jgi:hypothetical protein
MAITSLLKTLHGLERDCQKLGHFLLRFSQPLTNLGKLFSIHTLSPVLFNPDISSRRGVTATVKLGTRLRD